MSFFYFQINFLFKKVKSDISDSSKTSGGDTFKESTKIGISKIRKKKAK